ncbi:unnamed protein product [Trifolium pratense]|uniref:Uncharacterized protein n=1 Tax=Trifolium pratense TaxID=57577 RepID=A0ACB0LX51_TRIPR|nr:unnamed protein product [Trifolium pratense]
MILTINGCSESSIVKVLKVWKGFKTFNSIYQGPRQKRSKLREKYTKRLFISVLVFYICIKIKQFLCQMNEFISLIVIEHKNALSEVKVRRVMNIKMTERESVRRPS